MAEQKKKKNVLPIIMLVLIVIAALIVMKALHVFDKPAAEPAVSERVAATPLPERENAITGERFFNNASGEWVYHFIYAYPHFAGDDYAIAAVNDTYQTALDEMLNLVLPMFANEEEMYYDGSNEIMHDFEVECNNGRFLSVLQKRSQTCGEQGTVLTMEAQTFDMSGEYLGETLTLRGVVMVGDSSAQLGEALYPVLYDEFVKLQQAGVCKADYEWEDFELEFDPTRDFYADENGNAVFFFPPSLLTVPSFDVPTFSYSPEQLEQMAAEIAVQ